MKPAKQKIIVALVRIGKIALIFLCVFLSLIFLFITINKILKFDAHVVISESMEPEINKGDIIYMKKADKEKLKTGDIVIFMQENTNFTITHRIVEINFEERCVYTKGEQNTQQEKSKVKFNDILGVYVYKIPYIGNLF